MAVKANLGSSLTKIVIGVVTFITNAIEIVEELTVLIRHKASKSEVFRVIIAKKIRESIRQQQ